MKKFRPERFIIFFLVAILFFLSFSCYELKVSNDLWIKTLIESLEEVERLRGQIKKDPNVAISVYEDFSLASETSLTR